MIVMTEPDSQKLQKQVKRAKLELKFYLAFGIVAMIVGLTALTFA